MSKINKISLRPFQDADVTMLASWLHKDYILKWYRDPDAWLREIAGRDGEFSWIHHYVVMDGETPIGFCQYYDCYDGKDFEDWFAVTRRCDMFSIDYLIGDEDYLGKGYGKEIVRVLTEHIKHTENARQIIVQPGDENGASNGVLLANGYAYDEQRKCYCKRLSDAAKRKEGFPLKHEWKKHEKELYGATGKPAVITVPEQKFIMIAGTGDPNGPDFAERIGALYSLAYPIKMRHKASCATDTDAAKKFPYADWTVFPLEGVWTSPENNPLDKSRFEYALMIRQPDFVTNEMFAEALAVVKKKKPHPFWEQVAFEAVEEGLCVQMLHVGSYDAEPASFALLDEFSAKSGLKREGQSHREIYLNDARKTDPSKYRTILRYRVRAA